MNVSDGGRERERGGWKDREREGGREGARTMPCFGETLRFR